MNIGLRNRVVRVLAIALFAPLGGFTPLADPLPAEPEPFYVYSKQRVPLGIDHTKIAVRAASVADAQSAAARVGAPGAKAEPHTVPGWYTIPLVQPDALKAAADLAGARRAANPPPVQFVSPIYLGADGGPLVVTPDILMMFDPALARADARTRIRALAPGAIVEENACGLTGLWRIRPPLTNGADVLDAANRLARDPAVRFAEPDMIFSGRGDLIPGDTLFAQCWGLHNTGQSGGTPGADISAPAAWDITTGTPSITVCVIDVGVDPAHADVSFAFGNDLTGQGSAGATFNACDNHGTPVAGCVAARINALGTVGSAPGVTIASARTFIASLSCNGSWSSQASWTVSALTWAQSIGARVTNNSNYYGFTSGSIDSAYSSTRTAGLVHFASAGNDSSATITYPSSLPTVNAIAALNRSNQRASFSNFGAGLDFIAPGQSIQTTDRSGAAGWAGGDYVSANGTSFASPYTAGVAALVLSIHPEFSTDQVEAAIQAGCVDLGSPGYDTDYGWGRVNAQGALIAAGCTPTVDPLPANVPLNQGDTLNLSAPASGPGSLTYRWQHAGLDLADGPTPTGSVISGSATTSLVVTGVSASDAGAYALNATNLCGPSFSTTATVSVHCLADFNFSGAVTVQDVFEFLAAWFAMLPSADFNQSAAVSVQDIFDYLAAYFAGCA